MSTVQITFKPMSNRAALLGGKGFAEKIAKMARAATFTAATKAQGHMVGLIRSPKSGKVYGNGKGTPEQSSYLNGRKIMIQRAKKASPLHQASAPGESPANDTGNLLGSISVVQNEDQGGVLSSAVVVRATYANALEYGTRKMAERPFVQPTAEWVAPIFKKYIVKKLQKLNKTGEDSGGEE